MKRDVEMIRSGEATTEYNSNERIIYRIDDTIRRINDVKYLNTTQGLEFWLVGIQNLEQELSGALTEADEKDLAEVRVKRITTSNSNNPQIIILQRRKLEAYERKVRSLLLRIGLGFTAKKQDDPRQAMLR